MNPAEKAIKLVDRSQQRLPGLSYVVAVWKKFGDDQAGNLAAPAATTSPMSWCTGRGHLVRGRGHHGVGAQLWPRSLNPPPHTGEDVRAYQLYAQAETRQKDETVKVAVPDSAPDEKMPERAGGAPAGSEPPPVSAGTARGEESHDSGDDR
jgi:hypothetical protein